MRLIGSPPWGRCHILLGLASEGGHAAAERGSGRGERMESGGSERVLRGVMKKNEVLGCLDSIVTATLHL